MAPSIISFPTIFFTSSIVIIISISISPVQCYRSLALTPSPSPSPSPSPFIKMACTSRIIDTELCHRILESIPKVVSAKDLQSLAIVIIESGISNSTKTRTHIEATLKISGASDECKYAYDQVVERFGEALGLVKSHEYLYSTYELLTASTDYVKLCDAALAKEKVEDDVISIGNKVVPIFGMSAFSIVNQLR